MIHALSFLTPFGRRRASVPGPESLVWFPVVGALVGALCGAVWWSGQRWTTVVLAAALVVLADAVFTGGLHLDGLADSADGLVAPLDSERRLDAMADPAIGAFGAIALVTVLLVRWAALASIVAAPMLLAGLWCASRTLMAVTVCRARYARPGGLAEVFRGGSILAVCAVGGALTGALAFGAAGWQGATGVVVGLAVGVAVIGLALRRLDGYTGDVLGAAGVLTETAGLVAVAVVVS